MKKKTRIIFLFIALAFFLVLITGFVHAGGATGSWEEEEPKEKALEITYPQIPGVSTPKTVSSGLPEYIDYIFRFAVVIIGIIVLGVLIYNGFQYLTSAGNSEKLSDAKKGITSALLGAVILFSTYLIFNTINPQLTILELPDPDLIEPVVKPGIYLCNYNVPDINVVINEYISGDENTKINAVKELIYIMKNDKGFCFRVNFSGNLESFAFSQIKYKHTAFAIPRKEYVYDPVAKETKTEWRYDYGIIFHERDNWKSKCLLISPYDKINTDLELNFAAAGLITARSVTIFEKPTIKPAPEFVEVGLYECMAYNDPTYCPPDKKGSPDKSFYKTTSYIAGWSGKGVEKNNGYYGLGKLYENARSISIYPEGSCFAILFSEENFKGSICEIISKNDNNLLNQDIGRCDSKYGKCRWWVFKETVEGELKYCQPCLKSMIVVKGNVIY